MFMDRTPAFRVFRQFLVPKLISALISPTATRMQPERRFKVFARLWKVGQCSQNSDKGESGGVQQASGKPCFEGLQSKVDDSRRHVDKTLRGGEVGFYASGIVE